MWKGVADLSTTQVDRLCLEFVKDNTAIWLYYIYADTFVGNGVRMHIRMNIRMLIRIPRRLVISAPAEAAWR